MRLGLANQFHQGNPCVGLLINKTPETGINETTLMGWFANSPAPSPGLMQSTRREISVDIIFGINRFCLLASLVDDISDKAKKISHPLNTRMRDLNRFTWLIDDTLRDYYKQFSCV